MPYYQIPNSAQPLVDPQTGRIDPVWFTYLKNLATAQNTGGNAPADAVYVLGNSDSDLPNARVLSDSDSIDIDQGTAGQIKAHVRVDTSGALDGGVGADLKVRVDGVTVVINGSNQLEATGGGGGAPTTATYLTTADETATLTASRRLLAGTNVTFDDTVSGVRTINATGGSSAAGYWTVLTDGDVAAPELIYALGDVISVFVPA